MSDGIKIMESSKLKSPGCPKETTTEETRWFPRFTAPGSWMNDFYQGHAPPAQGEPPLLLTAAGKDDPRGMRKTPSSTKYRCKHTERRRERRGMQIIRYRCQTGKTGVIIARVTAELEEKQHLW